MAERILPAWLIVRGVDAVEPQLNPAPGLEPLADTAADVWLREHAFQADRDHAYRLSEPLAALTGTTQVFPREVLAETQISVARPDASALEITQRLNLDVRYGRIEHLPLQWPASFPADARLAGTPAIEIGLADGRPVAAVAAGDRLMLTLPEVMQGQIPLVLSYRLPLDAAAQRVQVPIFHSPEAPPSLVVVAFPESGTLQVYPIGAAWTRVPTALQPSWVARTPEDAFAATLSREVASAPQQYRVEAAFARVTVDASGRSQTRIEYELRRAPSRLAVEFPPGTTAITARWQGAAQIDLTAETLPSGAERVEVPLSTDGPRGDGRLVLEYLTSSDRALDALPELTLTLPVLPTAVVVDETIVELSLPSDYALLTYPRGLTPRFEWRPGLVFQRWPRAAYAEWRTAFQGGDADALASAGAADHVYPFWAAGDVTVVRFRMIGTWMLILLGSGLTLMLAFLLWSLPATRNVLTLLAIGFVVALAGVFASEAVELMLQPVLLGLMAAMVAIGLQVQRPPVPAVRSATP